MVNVINHINKPICYPVNAFSCFPKEAIEGKYNEENNRWYFKTATSDTFKTIDIEEAKEKGYYVPDVSSVFITNKYVFNYIFGFILIILSMFFLFLYNTENWLMIISLYTEEDVAGIMLVDLCLFLFIAIILYIIQIIIERNYTKKY